MSDKLTVEHAMPTLSFKVPAYDCPVHGTVEHVIASMIPGHEGYWCQICWLDMLDLSGVKRVKPIEEPRHG